MTFVDILAMGSISRMRKYISHDNLKRIVNAFVILSLDYCNSILYGLPEVEHDKLQRIQNIAARLITGTKRKEHAHYSRPQGPALAYCQIRHRF